MLLIKEINSDSALQICCMLFVADSKMFVDPFAKGVKNDN